MKLTIDIQPETTIDAVDEFDIAQAVYKLCKNPMLDLNPSTVANMMLLQDQNKNN